MSPEKQHSVLRRFKRFGLTEETLWREYLATTTEPVEKQQFLDSLSQLEKDSQAVTYASLYIHLLDQSLWGLLSPDEMLAAAYDILAVTAAKYGVIGSMPERPDIPACLKAWSEWMLACLQERLSKTEPETQTAGRKGAGACGAL